MDYRCQQCNRAMNVVDYLICAVCLACCRANHRRVMGLAPAKRTRRGAKR
jgi:hypothetical protein